MYIVMPHNLKNASKLEMLGQKILNTRLDMRSLFDDDITPDMVEMPANDAYSGGGKKPKRTRRKRRSLK
jgi:hypothetical protein